MNWDDLSRADWAPVAKHTIECPECFAHVQIESRGAHIRWHRHIEEGATQQKPRVVVYCEGERVSLADAASASVIIKIVKDRYGLAKVDFQRAIEAILP